MVAMGKEMAPFKSIYGLDGSNGDRALIPLNTAQLAAGQSRQERHQDGGAHARSGEAAFCRPGGTKHAIEGAHKFGDDEHMHGHACTTACKHSSTVDPTCMI